MRLKNPTDHRSESISIIVVSYNELPFLKRCLNSIKKTISIPYQLIIINNYRQNFNLISKMAKGEKNWRVIQNKTNRYYSGAINQGIRLSDGDNIVILNPDTIVTPHWLEGMIECAGSDPRIGMVVPCTNSAPGFQKVSAFSRRDLKNLNDFSSRWRETYRGQYMELHRGTGFCMFIKRKAIVHTGLWDERFLAGGYEDCDYCMRIWQAGYRIVLAQEVFIHHSGGQSWRPHIKNYPKFARRNKNLFIHKWCKNILMN